MYGINCRIYLQSTIKVTNNSSVPCVYGWKSFDAIFMYPLDYKSSNAQVYAQTANTDELEGQ